MSELVGDFVSNITVQVEDEPRGVPEVSLWSAVMNYAWLDISGNDDALTRKAMMWVEDTSAALRIGSFDWVCLHIGLDADRARAKFRTALAIRKARAKPSIGRPRLIPA